MLTVTVAFIVDCFVGDPESRYHPVVLLGQAIKRLDTLFYSEGTISLPVRLWPD